MSELKTYSHLADRRRVPSDYDIVTSRLLYYPDKGFEVATPGGAWLAEHQATARESGIVWEDFDDPRRTTYHGYVTARAASEAAGDAILRSMQARDYDAGLSDAWLATLDAVLPTLRFPLHGLQMASAYVAHAAPSGKLVVLGAFQTADVARVVQRLAQRLAMLRARRPTFGDASRAAWQQDPAWQPLRETIERLLVTYDWAVAFAALSLGVKPALDALLFDTLPRAARQAGDPLLGELLFAPAEDAEGHKQATDACLAFVAARDPQLADRLQAVGDAWRERAYASTSGLVSLLSSR